MSEQRKIHDRIRTLDDASLRRLVFLDATDYLPEAVEFARGELSRRRIPTLDPEEYWQQYPEEWIEGRGFCYPCWMQTTDESLGHPVTLYFVGVRLRGNEDPCPLCGSVVKTTWFYVVLPLVPIDRYRVVLGASGTYVGRKLKDQNRVREEHPQ
jgi:hypothetical protein